MARAPRLEFPGAIYHVTARGNERRALFLDDTDRHGYVALLAECRERFRFQLLAYCLMKNHVHLAIRTGSHPLSRIMARLHSIHAERFNRRHDRVGHLFQGRYKASLVRDDRYLYALLRYVHRNPVTARIVSRAADYPWSSDRFLRKGKGPAWLDVGPLLALLDGSPRTATRRYAALVDGNEPASSEDPRAAVERAVAGARVAEADSRGAHDPTLHPIRLDAILEIVATECGLSLADLLGRARGGEVADARCRAAYLARRLFQIPVRRVALRLRRDDSSFARPLARLENRLERDHALRDRIQRLTEALRQAAAEAEIRNQD